MNKKNGIQNEERNQIRCEERKERKKKYRDKQTPKTKRYKMESNRETQ